MDISIKDFLTQDKTVLEFCHELPLSSKNIDEQMFCFLENPLIKGKLRKIDGQVYSEFSISFHLVQSCSRCLSEVNETYDCIVQGYIVDDEIDEEEIILSKDGILEIEHILEIALMENVPTRILCSGDCKGLCASCGINLNESSCSCGELKDRSDLDPRLACLKKLIK